jgi:hypothetical protein
MNALIADMQGDLQALSTTSNEGALEAKSRALEAVSMLREATQSLLRALASDQDCALAVAVPYLNLAGFALGSWLMAKSAAIAASKLTGPDRGFYASKIQTGRFYAGQVLPRAVGLAQVVKHGAASVTETDDSLI